MDLAVIQLVVVGVASKQIGTILQVVLSVNIGGLLPVVQLTLRVGIFHQVILMLLVKTIVIIDHQELLKTVVQ